MGGAETLADAGMLEEMPGVKGVSDYVETVGVRGRCGKVDSSGLNGARAASRRSSGLFLQWLAGFGGSIEYEGTVAAGPTSYQAASDHGVGFNPPPATAHAFNDVFLATPTTGPEDANVDGAAKLAPGVVLNGC